MQLPTRILIIKLSSLGDILQSWAVLDVLKQHFLSVQIDWVVEESLASLLKSHPLITNVIPIDMKRKKHLWSSFSFLRKTVYDVAFDLQGNCKSAIVTLLCKSKVKVGYGKKSVREWPNLLVTHQKFEVSRSQNISSFYLGLIQAYFGIKPGVHQKTLLQISEKEKQSLFKEEEGPKIMVCPGSSWKNKCLSEEQLFLFLKKVEGFLEPCFFLIWGNEREKELCLYLQSTLKRAIVVDKLFFACWQNLIAEMDLMIAVDSCALHLCATTSTPSFSVFGPTSSKVFKPEGKEHVAVQGACPYQKTFEKQCPFLRTCPTGACIRSLKVEQLFQVFQNQCGFLQRSQPRGF